MTRTKLFCIPYAGGSASIYNKWTQFLDPTIELIPVELAGRGRRIHERLYKDVAEATNDAFSIVKEKTGQSPYALFGHSLGGMIAFELAVKIRECHFPRPVHMFFSGKRAPHLKKEDDKKYHLMNDEDFKRELISLGGTPSGVFDHPELFEMFLPIIRNDFRLAASAPHSDIITPFDEDITVFIGKDDDLTPEQGDGWEKHTRCLCNIHHFEGGHFFLHKETECIVNTINHTLK